MPSVPASAVPLFFAFVALPAGCTPVLHSPDNQDDTGSSTWVAPENTWPTATPPEGLEAEGFYVGEVPPDFRLLDQFGDTVSLWQFYGLVVVVDVSTMWCGKCQTLANDVDDTYQTYRKDGFIYLSIFPQTSTGEIPTTDDLEYWADWYGISAPVLSDEIGWTGDVVPDNSYPRLLVIGRDMRVANAEVTPTTDSAIRSAVELEL